MTSIFSRQFSKLNLTICASSLLVSTVLFAVHPVTPWLFLVLLATATLFTFLNLRSGARDRLWFFISAVTLLGWAILILNTLGMWHLS
jgi:hypothetical protein